MKHTDTTQQWPILRLTVIGVVCLALLVLGFGGWATFANLSGAVVIQGKLAQQKPNQTVQHPVGGVVRAIMVKEGDQVTANDLLIQLDDRAVRSELAIIDSRLAGIDARHDRLVALRDNRQSIRFAADLLARARQTPEVEAMLAGQRRLFAAEQNNWQQELAALQKSAQQITLKVDGIDAQIRALNIRLLLVDNRLADKQALLDKGLIRADVVQNLQQDQAVLVGKIGAINAGRAEAMARISGLKIERLRGETRRRADTIIQIRDLEIRQAELRENRRALLVRLADLSIRSPISGRVLGLGAISAQSVIKPAEPLMQVAPKDRHYVIIARIKPSDVDQLYPGQPVRLNFATIEGRQQTEFSGRLRQVSADLLRDRISGNMYYRAEIEPNSGAMALLAQRRGVAPGMPVELFIKTLDQPVWRYLAKPVLGYFSRAFREG